MRERGYPICLPLPLGAGEIIIVFARSDQFKAIGIGETLLPDRGGIIGYPPRYAPGKGFECIIVAVEAIDRQLHRPIPPPRVGASECNASTLLLRAADAADDQRSFRWKEVPVRPRSEEHTSELQSLMRNSYAGFCLQKHT